MARNADYDLITGRPRNEFPKKWTTLPGIGASLEPRQDNAVVPYSRQRDYDDGGEGGGYGGDVDDRFRALEERLVGSEKSNRALLEEIIRLQGDLKGVARRQEDSLSMERKMRMQLENSLRASNDLIAQMANRIKHTEECLQDEHSTVSALVTHTKNMEQNMTAQGQEMFSRKELQNNRVQDLRNELEEVMRAKDRAERVSYALVDEVRQLKSKLDTQSSDMAAQTADLKTRTRRLEDENRQGFDALRRQNETQASTELTTSQLRQQVETRLTELRDVIVELRGRQEQGNQETHRLEQQMQVRIGDVMTTIQEQSRQREEALHGFETMQRDKDHTADVEKTKLLGKIREIAEEVSKRSLMKEIKSREELQQHYTKLEVMVREEAEATHQFKHDIKRDMGEQLETIKKLSDSEVNATQELIKSEKKRQNETLQKLMEAQNLLDKQHDELKKGQDKILVAEIHSRKRHEKINNEKIQALQEKLSIATTTLQQALGGVSMQVNAVAEKLDDEVSERERMEKKGSKLKEIARLIDEQKAAIDVLNKHSSKVDKELKRLQTAFSDMTDDSVIEAIGDSVDSNKKTLAELEERMDELQREMKDIAAEGSSMGARTYTDLDTRITAQVNKINQLEDLFDAKIQAATATQAKNMWEKVESISLWQEITQQTLKEIQNQVLATSEEFYLADEQQQLMKGEVKQRVAAESEVRAREVEELKKQMSDLTKQFSMTAHKTTENLEENDLENIQASIRKLAESISTVKSVLSMKIQSEQKLRADEARVLRDEIAHLRALLNPLVKERAKPLRLFIKPEGAGDEPGDEVEKKAPPVNRWSLYTAYRWLVIKQRWLYLKWQGEFGTQNLTSMSWSLPNTKVKDKHSPKGADEKCTDNDEDCDNKD